MWSNYFRLPASIYILCVGTFINRAGTFVLVFITLYLRKKLGLSEQFATLAMGVAGLGSLLASLVGGHLADHIGRRPVMIGALVGGASIASIFGYFQTAPIIVLALFAFTFLSDMYRPAASAMIADLVEPQRRQQAYALMYVAINLGFAVAPLLGGWLIQRSYLTLFRTDAVTTLAYAVIILIAIKETHPLRAAKASSFLKPQTPQSQEHGQVPFLVAMGQIVRDLTFMRFALGMFLTSLIFVQSQSTLPLYMDWLGFSASDYGKVIAINGWLIVALQLPLTALVTRFPRSPMLILATMLVGAGFGLVAWSHTRFELTMTVVVWTLGEMVQSPLLPAIVGDLAPVHVRARYMGILTMCFSSSLMVGAPLGGLILAKLGANYLWGGGLVISTFAALMFASIQRELARRHRLVVEAQQS